MSAGKLSIRAIEAGTPSGVTAGPDPGQGPVRVGGGRAGQMVEASMTKR